VVDTVVLCVKISPMKKGIKTPTKLKGKRKHGFRARKKSAGGCKVLKRRRKKGRKRLIP